MSRFSFLPDFQQNDGNTRHTAPKIQVVVVVVVIYLHGKSNMNVSQYGNTRGKNKKQFRKQ